jgi:hypothetical protein
MAGDHPVQAKHGHSRFAVIDKKTNLKSTPIPMGEEKQIRSFLLLEPAQSLVEDFERALS